MLGLVLSLFPCLVLKLLAFNTAACCSADVMVSEATTTQGNGKGFSTCFPGCCPQSCLVGQALVSFQAHQKETVSLLRCHAVTEDGDAGVHRLVVVAAACAVAFAAALSLAFR